MAKCLVDKSVIEDAHKIRRALNQKSPISSKKWLEACGRDDLLATLDLVCQSYSTYFLCENHFGDEMFTSGRRRLLSTAVPTTFPGNDTRESVNDTVINDTVINDTVINDTVINDPVINDTVINDSVINDTVINDTVINDTVINYAVIDDTLDEPDIIKLDEITVKEEPLTDPSSEMEVPASPPFVNCESNNDSYIMDFLPEEPLYYPYQEMVCSPIDISDEEETTIEKHGSFLASSTLDSTVKLPENNKQSPMLTSNEMKTLFSSNLLVDSTNSITECRTCLLPVAHLKCAALYEKVHPEKTIKEMITTCVPQMADNLADGDVICENCLKRVNLCVNFIEDCLTADNTLKSRRKLSDKECVEVQHVKAEKEVVISKEVESSSQKTKNNESILTSALLQDSEKVDHSQRYNQTYKCSLCWRTYKSKYMLEDHKRKLHNIEREGGYTCQVCKLHFQKLKELEKHWMTHTAYCSTCKKREIKEKRKERNREYQREWRQRKKDLKKKVSEEEKKKEKRKRHRENQKAYYQRRKRLKENVQNVEEIIQNKSDDLQMFVENQFCEHIEDSIKATKSTSSQGKEVAPSFNYLSRSEDVHRKTSLEQLLYNCYKCERIIQGETKYIAHVKMHGHPNKLFSCDKCPKSYGNYKVLRYHQMMSHEKEKSSCKFCSAMIWNFNMPSHYRTRHTDEKMHFCKVCDDAFDNLAKYKRHLRKHISRGHVLPTKKHKNPSKNTDKDTADQPIVIDCDIDVPKT